MYPTSLIKFANRVTHPSGNHIYWERAAQDGAPFRGPIAPLFTEEEWDRRVVKVADAKNAFYDTQIAEENKRFLEVIETIANGWCQLLHLERFWQGTTKHYIEWLEYYMEDGHRTPYRPHVQTELSPNGLPIGDRYPRTGPP